MKRPGIWGLGFLRASLPWIALGWAFPLSHTWFLENRFFQTAWGPLHAVWILSCGLALASVSVELDMRRRGCLLVVLAAVVSYLATWLASFLFVPPSPDGSALLFVVSEFLLLGFVLWWAGRRLDRPQKRRGEVKAQC